MKYTKLTSDEIKISYEKLKSDWKLEDNSLVLEKKFPNFSLAFSFLTEVAMIAEKLNHHPTITNTYGTVKLEIWTHDVQGLSNLDFTFAQEVKNLMDMRRNLF